MKTIAVIGAGAAGTLVCAHVKTKARVHWIGRDDRFGPGLAYGTRDREHLLNVSVGAISAFSDQPLHFHEWLTKNHPELGALATDFVPRLYFGEYLGRLVPPDLTNITRHHDEAIDVNPIASGFSVSLKSGTRIEADEIVLAVGNLEPQKSLGVCALREPVMVERDARVLMIGTGLTMIDTVLSLRARGHLGEITAISRHGLQPRAHSTYRPHLPSEAMNKLFSSREFQLSRALRVIRSECRQAEASGSDWRAVFDLLRSQTALLWSRLSGRQRRQFGRHLRAYWDVHRHRVSPGAHKRIEELIQQGALQILRARKSPDDFDVVVDCTGLITDVAHANSPLIRALLLKGLVQLDDPALGIHANPAIPGIHVLGPLLRGQLWESVAIPEIRVQAREIATKLI